MTLQFGFSSKDIIGEGKITEAEIDVFNKWLASRSDDLPKYTEEQIIHFYLACDKVEKATKSTMIAYNALRNSTPQIFSKRDLDDSNLKKFVSTVNCCVFPKNTADGCAIILIKLVDSDYRNYDFTEYVKLIFMVLDAAIYDYPPTALLILVDISAISLMHLTCIKLNLIQKAARYLQTGLPVKLQNIHFINTTYMVFKALAIAKPFFSEKVVNMMICHSKEDTVPNIQNLFSKDCLPLEFGGELPSIDVLHKETLKKFREIRPHFEAEERQREPFKK